MNKKTTTPIINFLEKNKTENKIRLHMPGHKGVGGVFGVNDTNDTGIDTNNLNAYDITEIYGADCLYNAICEDEGDDIIFQSERNASRLFRTFDTYYSAGGSTLCIQTMLAVFRELPFVAVRNVHVSFVNACGLLGIDPVWVMPEYTSELGGEISPESIEKALKECAKIRTAERKKNPKKIFPTVYGFQYAVYLTSPDYTGKIADIKAISAVCKKHNAVLLVDNAHGSHLAFFGALGSNSAHPIHLGADFCCDSAHKMLPVLTGGAYLHVSEGFDKKVLKNMKRDGVFRGETSEDILYAVRELVKKSMSIFGSSSPSYLILASLDGCNAYLEKQVYADVSATFDLLVKLNETLVENAVTKTVAQSAEKSVAKNSKTKSAKMSENMAENAVAKTSEKTSKKADTVKKTVKKTENTDQTTDSTTDPNTDQKTDNNGYLSQDPYHVVVKNCKGILKKLEKVCVPEYVSAEFIILLFSPKSKVEDILTVAEILKNHPKLKQKPFKIPLPQKVMSIREAMFGDMIGVARLYGICTEVEFQCPPGIANLIPGEAGN